MQKVHDQDFGATTQKVLGFYDPDTHSLRTSAPSLLEDLTRSLAILPKSGLMQGGVLYELPKLEPPTDVSVCSSLLPTPTASDWKGPNLSGSGTASSRSISTIVALLPTPTASNYGRNRGASPGAAIRPSLNKLVKMLHGETMNSQSDDGRS